MSRPPHLTLRIHSRPWGASTAPGVQLAALRSFTDEHSCRIRIASVLDEKMALSTPTRRSRKRELKGVDLSQTQYWSEVVLLAI